MNTSVSLLTSVRAHGSVLVARFSPDGHLLSRRLSVAEFYEDDVNTKMTAALSLIEPAIMIFMGIFVAFVLIALYMPIFSLADTIR